MSSCAKVSLVGFYISYQAFANHHYVLGIVEEFAIYMNYVRKLGFEETPDYEFLRELFSKVLKTLGEVEDGVFDWMLLNGGKGWEAGNVCFQLIIVIVLFKNHPDSLFVTCTGSCCCFARHAASRSSTRTRPRGTPTCLPAGTR